MILACSRAPLQCNRRYMGSTAILEVPRTFVDFAEHTANQGSRSPHRKRDKACAPAMLDRLTQAQVSASGSWSVLRLLRRGPIADPSRMSTGFSSHFVNFLNHHYTPYALARPRTTATSDKRSHIAHDEHMAKYM